MLTCRRGGAVEGHYALLTVSYGGGDVAGGREAFVETSRWNAFGVSIPNGQCMLMLWLTRRM